MERKAAEMKLQKTSVFPASRKTVFEKLQKLETLQYIASPFATFEPVGNAASKWEAGDESSYRFRLFGFIPYGTHTIRIIRFDPDRISSREGNEHVPVWNHDITLVSLDDDHTQYTDHVEIHAGWKTVFVWLWANLFYAHRQRKWVRLLRNKGMDAPCCRVPEYPLPDDHTVQLCQCRKKNRGEACHDKTYRSVR